MDDVGLVRFYSKGPPWAARLKAQASPWPPWPVPVGAELGVLGPLCPDVPHFLGSLPPPTPPSPPQRSLLSGPRPAAPSARLPPAPSHNREGAMSSESTKGPLASLAGAPLRPARRRARDLLTPRLNPLPWHPCGPGASPFLSWGSAGPRARPSPWKRSGLRWPPSTDTGA